MSLLEDFYNLLFHPLYFLKKKSKSLILCIFITLLVTLSLLSLIPGIEKGDQAFLFFSLLVLIFLSLFFFSIFYHFFCGIFKGKGEALPLYISLLYSLWPLILLAPLRILCFKGILQEVFSFILFITLGYVIFLQINAMRLNYSLEGGTVLFIYFLPLIFSFFLSLLALFLILLLLFGVALKFYSLAF